MQKQDILPWGRIPETDTISANSLNWAVIKQEIYKSLSHYNPRIKKEN